MSDDTGEAADHPQYRLLAELVIDIAREIQLRAVQTTPVIPLTQTQGQVMRFVHSNPGCSASDIADGSGLQRANVSTALRELRGRGYITSRRDDDDGRAIRIEATELADETIGKLRTSWAELVERAWKAGAGDEPVPHDTLDTLSRIRNGLNADRATKLFRLDPPAAVERVADSTVSAGIHP